MTCASPQDNAESKGYSRDREATKTRLLDAAVAVFATRGYEAASLKEISERAVANVSLINRYFGGKEALLVAITERFIARKRGGSLPYPPQPTLEGEIRRYLEHRLVEDSEQFDMVKLMVSRVAIDEQFRAKAMAGMSGGADQNLRERLERLQANGLLSRSIDLDELFAMIAYFAFSTNFFGAGIGMQTAKQIEQLFDKFAWAIARGIKE